jgi:hypothetical protein
MVDQFPSCTHKIVCTIFATHRRARRPCDLHDKVYLFGCTPPHTTTHDTQLTSSLADARTKFRGCLCGLGLSKCSARLHRQPEMPANVQIAPRTASVFARHALVIQTRPPSHNTAEREATYVPITWPLSSMDFSLERPFSTTILKISAHFCWCKGDCN